MNSTSLSTTKSASAARSSAIACDLDRFFLEIAFAARAAQESKNPVMRRESIELLVLQLDRLSAAKGSLA
jgi:hypothetical protein